MSSSLRCVITADICSYNSCDNSGTCVPSVDGSFYCSCPSGFTGRRCEKVDLCQSLPCKNKGVCLSDSDTFRYVLILGTLVFNWFWKKGYFIHCLVKVGCLAILIYLLVKLSSHRCQCMKGFSGEFCEISCVKVACQNGGQCTVVDDYPVCVCLPGWTGQFCQNDIDECQAKVADACQQRQARCFNYKGGYACNCHLQSEGK